MLGLASLGQVGAFGCYRGFGGCGFMPYTFGYGDFFPFLGLLKLIVALGLLALIVYLVVKVSKKQTEGGSESGKALEILKERYARGELTEEEFTKMKKTLLG